MERQTGAIEKSAEAAENSIKLQETALRQWVDIKEWRSIPWIPVGTEEWNLHIQFDVVNPTDKPLTLNGVFIKIGEEEKTIIRKNLIPPEKWHPVVMSVKITEEQALKWEDLKELIFLVNGYIEFEDVLEKIRNQPFNGMIGCSKKGGVRFIPPYGSGLYITGEKKEG